MATFGWLVVTIFAIFSSLLFFLVLFNPFKTASDSASDMIMNFLMGAGVGILWYISIANFPFIVTMQGVG